MRYIKLYAAFLRTCAMREMESRGSFFAKCLTVLIYPVVPLLFVGAIYGQITNLQGWTLYQYLVLVGTFQCINAFIFAMFFKNIFEIGEYVRKGELDFILLKPVNSQFMISTRYFAFEELAQFIPGIALIWIGLANSNISVDWWRWPIYLGFIVCGLIISYSLWFISAIPALWAVKMEAPQLFISILDVARFHPSMFNGVIQGFLIFIVPLGVIASTPADLLLNRLDWLAAVWAVMLAGGLLYLSSRLWKFAQTRYHGASA